MKDVVKILLIVFFIVSCSVEIISAPFDTGMSLLQQPNGVTFTGRIWGDEFIYWAETQDGYRFVQSGDGWYYYATLNAQGEYTATTYKVGINTPPSSSYQLERTQQRLEEIGERIQNFNSAVQNSAEWFAEKQAEADALGQPSVNLSIGIILIQFPDFPHFSSPYRPNGYTKADFENMMFSENDAWFDTTGTTPHPENEKIYGSFKDYWSQMSKGKLRVGGRVVNPDQNGVIEWLTTNYNRSYYELNSLYFLLANEAINKATDSNWINPNPGHPDHFDKLIIVFAHNGIRFSNLATYADPDQNYIQVAERSSEELWINDDFTFTHMGLYAHEFGHNLGFQDEYLGIHDESTPLDGIYYQEDGGTDTYNFDLMSWGIYNGPLRKGECPATLSPYYRIKSNWIEPTIITEEIDNRIIEYNYSNPVIYRINPIDAFDEKEHFLFESRGREGFDRYLPWSPSDTINQPGRLIVWYHNMKWVYEPTGFTRTDRSRIINADDTRHWFSQLTDFFPSAFNPTTQDYNDLSVPATKMGYLQTGIPGIEGNYRPAHFAINGIQKLNNGNSFINQIRPNFTYVNNQFGTNSVFLSVPVGLDNYSLNNIFPSATSAFKFSPINGYQQVQTLNNGAGYWITFSSSNQDITHAGSVIQNIELALLKGWNLVGTISDPIKISSVCFHPSSIINRVWSYTSNAGYSIMSGGEYLTPGVGYWFETNDVGSATMTRFGSPCELPKITSETTIDLSVMDKFTVTDANGNSQSLYVVNTDIDSSLDSTMINLPPASPEVYFDSRFVNDEYIKKVSATNGTVDLDILVQAVSFPITLTWELNPANGIQYSFIGDSGLGKISSIGYKNGSAIFNSLENKKIKLFAFANTRNLPEQLPSNYNLLQCYPNPFNPSTNIKYAIKNDGIVSLKVYNAIGEEIRTLINEFKVAGNYNIEFNAGNLPSGVYIYKLQAGDFVSSKKMILLK